MLSRLNNSGIKQGHSDTSFSPLKKGPPSSSLCITEIFQKVPFQESENKASPLSISPTDSVEEKTTEEDGSENSNRHSPDALLSVFRQTFSPSISSSQDEQEDFRSLQALHIQGGYSRHNIEALLSAFGKEDSDGEQELEDGIGENIQVTSQDQIVESVSNRPNVVESIAQTIVEEKSSLAPIPRLSKEKITKLSQEIVKIPHEQLVNQLIEDPNSQQLAISILRKEIDRGAEKETKTLYNKMKKEELDAFGTTLKRENIHRPLARTVQEKYSHLMCSKPNLI